MEESTWVELVLPVTPGIGDEIEIPFIEETGKDYREYVHCVRHKISGKTQEVYLEVHPFYDYYYKWEKMREDFDQTKSWLKSLKRQ